MPTDSEHVHVNLATCKNFTQMVSGSISEWRSVMSGIPQRVILGLMLFNIFISEIDSGIESIFSKSVNDTKLWDAIDMFKGWDAIQGHLDRLEQ